MKLGQLPPKAEWNDGEWDGTLAFEDNLLRYLVKPNGVTCDDDLAKVLHQELYRIREALKRISTEKEDLMRLQFLPVNIIIVSRDIRGIAHFINECGGFTKIDNERRKKERLEAIKLEREVHWWKDPRFWLGALGGALTTAIMLLGIYLAWIKEVVPSSS